MLLKQPLCSVLYSVSWNDRAVSAKVSQPEFFHFARLPSPRSKVQQNPSGVATHLDIISISFGGRRGRAGRCAYSLDWQVDRQSGVPAAPLQRVGLASVPAVARGDRTARVREPRGRAPAFSRVRQPAGGGARGRARVEARLDRGVRRLKALRKSPSSVRSREVAVAGRVAPASVRGEVGSGWRDLRHNLVSLCTSLELQRVMKYTRADTTVLW